MPLPYSNTALNLAENQLTAAECSLLKALLYFRIFDHPLTANELWSYSTFGEKALFGKSLEGMLQQGYILRQGNYYQLPPVAGQASARHDGQQRVQVMWPKACLRARLIQRFPFVRAVFISGSISKGVVATDGDVDFFIITKPQYLWLSRTLLALYKKVFLLGSYKYFCINYFIDSNSLTIEEQNIYTATEMATLIPMAGDARLVRQFFESNAWVGRQYPNFKPKEVLFESPEIPFMKRWLEFLFSHKAGRLLDRFCQKMTTTFWKLKFKSMADEDYKVALKSSQHVSKHHPLYFQKKVLQAYEQNRLRFETENGMKL